MTTMWKNSTFAIVFPVSVLVSMGKKQKKKQEALLSEYPLYLIAKQTTIIKWNFKYSSRVEIKFSCTELFVK